MEQLADLIGRQDGHRLLRHGRRPHLRERSPVDDVGLVEVAEQLLDRAVVLRNGCCAYGSVHGAAFDHVGEERLELRPADVLHEGRPTGRSQECDQFLAALEVAVNGRRSAVDRPQMVAQSVMCSLKSSRSAFTRSSRTAKSCARQALCQASKIIPSAYSPVNPGLCRAGGTRTHDQGIMSPLL